MAPAVDEPLLSKRYHSTVRKLSSDWREFVYLSVGADVGGYTINVPIKMRTLSYALSSRMDTLLQLDSSPSGTGHSRPDARRSTLGKRQSAAAGEDESTF